MTVEEVLQHAGELTPEDIKGKARKLMRHYIWTWQKGKNKLGWCTHCGKKIEHLERLSIEPPSEPDLHEFDYVEEDYKYRTRRMNDYYDATAKHMRVGDCPSCGTAVQFRSIRKGTNMKEPKIFLIVYRKSAVDPKSLVCIGYRIEALWSVLMVPGTVATGELPNDWWRRHRTGNDDLPLDIKPTEICVFRWGKPAIRIIKERRWCAIGELDEGWEKRRKCESGYNGWISMMGHQPDVMVYT